MPVQGEYPCSSNLGYTKRPKPPVCLSVACFSLRKLPVQQLSAHSGKLLLDQLVIEFIPRRPMGASPSHLSFLLTGFAVNVPYKRGRHMNTPLSAAS